MNVKHQPNLKGAQGASTQGMELTNGMVEELGTKSPGCRNDAEAPRRMGTHGPDRRGCWDLLLPIKLAVTQP